MKKETILQNVSILVFFAMWVNSTCVTSMIVFTITKSIKQSINIGIISMFIFGLGYMILVSIGYYIVIAATGCYCKK